ncbi:MULTISPECIES: DUF5326 family protein [Streptomyces]|uniref:DUF5326 family protein n=1 Tax=Streptomyces sudanensis TaxID=436397 RepID=A0ABY4TD67_9ACTN|nr:MULTISPECIES: DUF5326 family protein [Streptomyces]MCP9958184.1 DUF5326 family protein [Streptomyces sudanensis]MCP9987307.1 DUF5326 family protein [Streptomyces sudanensis]MCQ0001296.1 DUF5326 family protein [Streptomyces sudanensis]URN16896.1 DUF5326 family protein [Streptomyces sudanensis]
MAVRGLLTRLPWWVKWVAAPVIAVAVFGSVIATVAYFVVSLLFKALALVALVGGLVYIVRKFRKTTPSSRDGW